MAEQINLQPKIIRIGLSGKLATGKSLVADYLIEKYQFKRISFAARVKELAAELFGYTDKKTAKGRSVLQQLAQHMREIDPDVWARYTIKRMPQGCNIVVDDVRYPNEFEMLHEAGFVLVRMMMDKAERKRVISETYPGLPDDLLLDSSETALDGFSFDYYIDNGSHTALSEVYKQADNIYSQLRSMSYDD